MEATLIFICLIFIFYCSFFCGKYLTKSSRYIAKLGEKIYIKKIYQYENSGFFKPLRNAIAQGSLSKGLLIILPLIILKSVAFYFISILLITPLILIFQGITMGSLFAYHKNQHGNAKDLAMITFWQLFSHLAAATYGYLSRNRLVV